MKKVLKANLFLLILTISYLRKIQATGEKKFSLTGNSDVINDENIDDEYRYAAVIRAPSKCVILTLSGKCKESVKFRSRYRRSLDLKEEKNYQSNKMSVKSDMIVKFLFPEQYEVADRSLIIDGGNESTSEQNSDEAVLRSIQLGNNAQSTNDEMKLSDKSIVTSVPMSCKAGFALVKGKCYKRSRLWG